MPSHKSSVKRVRQTTKKNLRNKMIHSSTRTSIKKTRAAIESGDREAATTALLEVTKKLASAASKGALHQNNASRKISRLTRQVNQIS